MTKIIKRTLSLMLTLLMAFSMVSVFSVPSFAATGDFDTDYNGSTIGKDALLVTNKAYGKLKNDVIVEIWEGISYNFTVGVNAFGSLDEAFTYAENNNIRNPNIIVANWDKTEDLVVTAPANIYAPNYATSPFNENKTANAAMGDGGDWTENTSYINNQLTVRNIVFDVGVSGGTVKIAGFTFRGCIDDGRRSRNSSATNITLENIMKDGDVVNKSSRYMIICDNSNTSLANSEQSDALTINNFYIKSTGVQSLIGENVCAYTTFDGLWVDIANTGMGTLVNYIRQGADKAAFTIKNSNLRNFRRSDLSRNQDGIFYFEGRNKYDVSAGMSSAIVFDNNILHKFSSRTGGDGVTYVIGWHANSYTDFRFTNNYFDHVSNPVATAGGYDDTSRFFHTTVESYSACEALECYGTAVITGNTINGCRLKFEITNNSVAVPYTMDVHDNFMVEDRREELDGVIGEIPEVNALHTRTENVSMWLDVSRTKSSGEIYPYTFSSDVTVDDKTKTVTYKVGAYTDNAFFEYGTGNGYIFSFYLGNIIENNEYGNIIRCNGNDIFSEEVKVYTDTFVRNFEFELDIYSPDGTKSEKRTLNIDASEYVLSIMDSCEVFDDVKHASWYEEYVNFVYLYEIMNGTNTGDTFEPDTTLSRAMTVTIIARMSGVDTDSLKNTATKFSDVPAGKWYTGAVAWAVDAGITTGTSNTTFDPDADVTRQDTCVLLVRYADYANITLGTATPKTVFPDDSEIGSWAKDAVYACQQAGIVNGTSDGSFAPKGNTTRSAAAKMFAVFCKDYIL